MEVNYSGVYYDKKPYRNGAIFFAVGIIISALIFVSPFVYGKYRDEKYSDSVEGVIIDVRYNDDGDATAPTVSYNYNGVDYQYKAYVYTSFIDYKVGDNITVFVNPSKPSECYIKTVSLAFIPIIIGVILAIISMVGLYYNIREINRKEKVDPIQTNYNPYL